MSLDTKCAEKRRSSYEMDDADDFQDHMRSTSPSRKTMVPDDEKRMRREIANSNERRRMQSINSGFQSLKTIIPHQDNEKLSKAAILHQASDYITMLETEKNQLLNQNAFLRKRLKEIAPHQCDNISPAPKRKKRDTESSDEGISMNFDDGTEILEMRKLLQRERHQRQYFEEKTKSLEAQLNPDGFQQMASQESKQLSNSEEMQMDVDKKIDSASMPPPPVTPAARIIPSSCLPMSAPQDIPVKHEPATPAVAPFTSPQSKRNLEMIAEAIRHLEGDHCVFDKQDSHSFRTSPSHMGSSEESQTESSTSDQEDSKSDSSGRSSPHAAVEAMVTTRDYVPSGIETQTATLHVSAPQSVFALPANGAIQMLHHPHLYSQPGYLIQMNHPSS